jgi:hypothetical protein
LSAHPRQRLLGSESENVATIVNRVDRDTSLNLVRSVSHMRKVGMGLLVAALELAACAGQSDEERCKTGGGVWKQNSC